MRRTVVVFSVFGVIAFVGVVVSGFAVRADLPSDRDPTWLLIAGSIVAVLMVLTFAIPALTMRRRARDPESTHPGTGDRADVADTHQP